ncbi:hypothetical protein FisN_7Hh373 [Fistulifera solaris]|uniref:Uncharacterized protein n=1 Tax=Fistulifera solaris TaxID=1519565 RepID=A0A1Z5KSG0_FISSO|nr:hypothetical protein FisN_7Hh373 [Fistulifera solaris]|eukprot:GAX29035.1 hypothetical protein FisN_7Hh373 [Fistulifera solaris]
MLQSALQRWAHEISHNFNVEQRLQEQEDRVQQIEYTLQPFTVPFENRVASFLEIEHEQQRAIERLSRKQPAVQEITTTTSNPPTRPKPCPESLLYDSVLQDKQKKEEKENHRTRRKSSTKKRWTVTKGTPKNANVREETKEEMRSTTTTRQESARSSTVDTKRASSIQVALQQLDESMALLLTNRSSLVEHQHSKQQSTSSSSTTSEAPSTVVASRWTVAEDDSALYCPTLVPGHAQQATGSAVRRPSNIQMNEENVRNHEMDLQLTIDEEDDDPLQLLTTCDLDQKYHLEQDLSKPHGFRVVPNDSTTTPRNQTTTVESTKSTVKTTNYHPTTTQSNGRQLSSSTPMRLLQHEMQQHHPDATLLLHQTLSSPQFHPNHDDEDEDNDDENTQQSMQHSSSTSNNNCSLFQDTSQDHTRLPFITEQEYSAAPRIVQMQMSWENMNQAIEQWNQTNVVTPIPYEDALEIWNSDATPNRVVLMALCHFRRLWLKSQEDGKMWFDVCL